MKNNTWIKPAITFFALSATTFTAHGAFEGFYGNLSFGALQTGARINLNSTATPAVTDDPVLVTLSISQQERVWQNEAIGALALGYGQFVSQHIRLAGEVFLNVSNSRATLDHYGLSESTAGGILLATTSTAKLHNWEFGLDFVPSLQIDPCNLLYARVGLAINQLHLEHNSILHQIDAGFEPTDSPLYLSPENHRLGLRLGLGVEHGICPNFAVTLDYIFTYYDSVDVSGSAEIVNVVDGATFVVPAGIYGNATASYRTQALMAGLKYYFF